MEWMLMPLKRYAQFSGRSRRKEYWMFILFVIIVSVLIGIVEGIGAEHIGGWKWPPFLDFQRRDLATLSHRCRSPVA